MTSQKIIISGPSIVQQDIDAVAEAAAQAWYDNAYCYVRRFERAVCELTGRRYALALPSGSAGLHLALLGMGIGVGDEVIVADSTWIATGAAIVWVGATPVFADVDRQTWCLTPETVEPVLTPRTKAIIAVDLYGQMPPMERLQRLADTHGVPLIEDAAEAIGSFHEGAPAGAFGAASIFSFAGNKTLTCGEGGMIVTDDAGLFERFQTLAEHGRKPSAKAYLQTEIGQRYRMSDLQAALGCSQLDRLPRLIAEKDRIHQTYRRHLERIEGVTLNVQPVESRVCHWMTNVVLNDPNFPTPGEIAEELMTQQIETRPFFYPLSLLPAFYAYHDSVEQARKDNTNSYYLHQRGLTLPSSYRMDEDSIKHVCQTFKRVLLEKRKDA